MSKKLIPQKLNFRIKDYFRVFYSWMFAFKITHIIEPGLYYLGEKYSIDSPLIVTANYHMTVFLLWRRLRHRSIRILVIDTKGINVWCSSGKGQFSAREIIKQLDRYEKQDISDQEKIKLIIPKLSLSGVSLTELRNRDIIPEIGPVYMDDIEKYLDDKDYRKTVDDKYEFNLKDRLFILPSSLIQFTKYSIGVAIFLFILHLFLGTGIYWQVIPLFVMTGILYVSLFPLLPTNRFSLKGLFLGGILSLLVIFDFFYFHWISNRFYVLLFYIFNLLATNIFFGLYFTGNSGVSNYTLTKKEIIRFLPVTVVLYSISLVLIITYGVTQ